MTPPVLLTLVQQSLVPAPGRTGNTGNGNGTVTDRLTGLMWVKNGNLMASRDPGFDTDGTAGDGQVTWQHALDYVAKLNQERYLGYSDWRLPNVNELRSLSHYGQASPDGWLNSQGFTNIQGGKLLLVGEYLCRRHYQCVGREHGRWLYGHHR